MTDQSTPSRGMKPDRISIFKGGAGCGILVILFVVTLEPLFGFRLERDAFAFITLIATAAGTTWCAT